MDALPVIFSQKRPSFEDLTTHGEIIATTWAGQKIAHAVRYLFWVSDTHLHFLAGEENGPALSHPESSPSQFKADLWKYDVAEFFLRSADHSRYLEFNLAPNGAWWSSAFISPRQTAPGEPTPIPGVTTSAQHDADSWQAMASIPLPWLQDHYGFGEKTTLNATFILNSPQQIFLTAGNLGGGEPDFHRPDHFPELRASRLEF